jgi:hypothetical protein
LVDSYRNTISEWAVGFRYGNFTLKLARGKKSFFLEVKKFPYLKLGPFGNPIFIFAMRYPVYEEKNFLKNPKICKYVMKKLKGI